MESPADCQRARETWSYGRQEHSRQIRASAHHAPAPSSVTDLEDVCSQSPGGDDCYRLSNRPNRDVQHSPHVLLASRDARSSGEGHPGACRSRRSDDDDAVHESVAGGAARRHLSAQSRRPVAHFWRHCGDGFRRFSNVLMLLLNFSRGERI